MSTRRVFVKSVLAALAVPELSSAAGELDALDGLVQKELSAANIPGLALGYAVRGKVLFTRAYGYADLASRRNVDPDTMFHIASISKVVTATAVMQLVEAGRMRLDDPIADYLDFEVVNPRWRQVPLTFRHLLMHTSSISDAKYYDVDFRVRGSDSTVALDAFLKDYLVAGGHYYDPDKCYSAARPGEAWGYSNVSYGLLGYLASRIGGKDMRDMTMRSIFAPLEMRHTSWTLKGTSRKASATPYDVTGHGLTPVEPVGFPDWSAGMLRSSISDLTKFVAASANDGELGSKRTLSARSQAEMFQMQTPAGLPAWLTGQGLGWQASMLDGSVRLNHWGGDPGVFTAAYIDVPTRSCVVILTNVSASAESKSAIKNIAGWLFSQGMK